MRLRLGIPFSAVGALFGVNERVAGDVFNAILLKCSENFVPKHYGFGHLSRETVLKDYTPDLSKTLFPKL